MDWWLDKHSNWLYIRDKPMKRWLQMHPEVWQSLCETTPSTRSSSTCSSSTFTFPTHKDMNTLFIFETRHRGGGISLWTVADEILQCCTSAAYLSKTHWNAPSPCPIRFIRRPIGGATDVPHRASGTWKISGEHKHLQNLLLYNNMQPHPQKPRRSAFENSALASASARNYKRGCVTSI